MQDNKKFIDVIEEEYGNDFDKKTGGYEGHRVASKEEKTLYKE